MTLTTERQQFAAQNEMSMEFVNWFFDEKKDGCGNAWFIMAAAMWEGWKGRATREAQPVYQYRMRNPYNGQVTGWETIKPEQVDFILKETIAASVEFRIIAAPPAPSNAQPVAWEMRYWNSGHNCWHDWERITAEQHAEMSVQHATDNDYEFRVLYDAPAAPAVPPIDYEKEMRFFAGRGSSLRVGRGYYTAPPAPAVNAAPDFEAWFNSPEAGLRVVNFHIQHELQLKAWNACRAAMLAQHVSQSYTLNSPEIPDGWKLVPVEPTEEMLRAAYRESGVYSAKAYRVMLAAAPEGGK
ncbi:TPA: hypothetical protein ACKPY3_003421 [Serratia marcescens]